MSDPDKEKEPKEPKESPSPKEPKESPHPDTKELPSNERPSGDRVLKEMDKEHAVPSPKPSN